jgi:hypothetical protein
MASIGEEFQPGEKVPHSGIYKVMHDKNHAADHEVTCIYDKVFPQCRECGQSPRFRLVRIAQHIDLSEHFKK